MPKQKITVTIDKRTAEEADAILKDRLFRSRSHLVEYSLINLLNKINRENNSIVKEN
jgi:metal-responsive CopG/Arc/MetJ family transcriptional regulator